MPDSSYSHIAACCRQAYNGVRRPAVVVESALNFDPGCSPQIVDFFYEDSQLQKRVTNEDLREVFYLLTDLYPSEVAEDEEPDLVQVLSQLSKEVETTSTFLYAWNQLNHFINAPTNKVRALVARSMLKRTTARDMYWWFLRSTRNANPFKRRDIVIGIAKAFDLSLPLVRRQANITDLQTICEMAYMGEEMIGIPATGDKILLPLPIRWKEKGRLPFTNCYLEVIRGERLTLHTWDNTKGIRHTILLDPNGNIIENRTGVQELEQFLTDGIYVVERTLEDDFPLRVVDKMMSDLTHYQRRKVLEDILPEMFIKPLIKVDSYQHLLSEAPKSGVCFIHNSDHKWTYTCDRKEIALFSTKHRGDVFRLVGGVWTHDDARGLTMSGWRVAARDGIDGYYEVGTISADIDIQKQLEGMVDPAKALEGEMALASNPTFVEVEVHFAEYEERGVVIQGVIRGISQGTGISDVVPVEEVEWLVGGEEE